MISRNFCLISETETWPVIFKSGEKQMANVLWYNEGLFVDLPFGYVDDLTQVYDSTGNTIQYRQKIKFPPKLYYPMMEIEQATTEVITKKVLFSVANSESTQCRKFRIFLPLSFYVKPIFGHWNVKVYHSGNFRNA